MATPKLMLAHTYSDKTDKELVNGWYISTKYDGVRGYWNHKKKEMFSRNGNIYTLPDFFRDQLLQIPIDLDGEIWFGYGTFDIASGAARKTVNDPEIWKSVQYMVFDTPNLELIFEDRIELIRKILSDLKPKNIKLVKYTIYDPKTMDILEELEREEKRGGEGLILRKPGTLYEQKRSKYMLKVKSWTYDEGIVIGYNEGKKNYMVGSLILQNDTFGTFNVNAGSDEQRYSGFTSKHDWSTKKTQDLINSNRKKFKNTKLNEFNKSDEYINLINKIKTSKGTKKMEFIQKLNKSFGSIPIIGDYVTFRFKEETKNGQPKFATFVNCRDYE
jgi:DNA ligase-1